MPGGLWVDKHRPNTLDKLVVHKDIGANLRNLVRAPSLFASAARTLAGSPRPREAAERATAAPVRRSACLP
jgi:hypothetical protein